MRNGPSVGRLCPKRSILAIAIGGIRTFQAAKSLGLPCISKLWWTTLSSRNTRDAHVTFSPAFSRSLLKIFQILRVDKMTGKDKPMEQQNEDFGISPEFMDRTGPLVDSQCSYTVLLQRIFDDYKGASATGKEDLTWAKDELCNESAQAEKMMLFAPKSVTLMCAKCRTRV